MSYVDLHLHLLPGVDDGPRTERVSLEHARRMVRDGVTEAVVTPHVGHPSFPLDVATIPGHTRSLQVALDRAGIALRLHPGGEIHPSAAASLTAAELEVVAQGPRGARWVLLEVPFAGIDSAFLDGCRAIRSHGFGLVIAHPERASGLLEEGLQRLTQEIAAGAVLQVNVCSLRGDHGPEIQTAARLLVRERLAYVIASDGHAGTRRQTLRIGFHLAMSTGASPTWARQLTDANPGFLLRDGLRASPGAPVPREAAWQPRRGQLVRAARHAARQLARSERR